MVSGLSFKVAIMYYLEPAQSEDLHSDVPEKCLICPAWLSSANVIGCSA